MKKILILANNDIGLYNFRKEILQALLKVPYEVHIALPYGSFVEPMVEMGCKFHNTQMERRGTNPFQEVTLLRRYGKLLKKIKPDVVLTYTIKPNIYGGILCSLKKIPYITTITGLGTAVEGDGILQKVTVSLYRFAMRKVRFLFFQNEDNETFFKEKDIAASRHVRIPGSGVNLDRYVYLSYPDPGLNPVERAEFLFISRVMKEKGIEQYLAMAEAIKQKYPHTKFHILGFCEEDEEKPDSYRKKIAEMEERGIVEFQGMQKDIVPFLKASQCTVHPSFYPEGMSNVCLESAASGRPVITTNRPGCKDTIDDGKTGFLVREQDTEDLIQKVEMFLQLPYEKRKEMGIEAHKKMVREFDRNIVVKKYLEAIAEV